MTKSLLKEIYRVSHLTGYSDFSWYKPRAKWGQVNQNKFRSSCPEVFSKKGVLRNFTKFTGKHLYQSLLLNKVAGLRPEGFHFIKKQTLTQVFFCKFCEVFKGTFLTDHLQWLLLSFVLFKSQNENLFRLIFETQIHIHIHYFKSLPLATYYLSTIHIKNRDMHSKIYHMG